MASLVVVIVVASMGAGLIQMHGASGRRQTLSIDTKRALYVAEAGLSEAFMAVTHGKSGNVGTEEVPASFGDGVYWVVAEDHADGVVRLVSTGLCGTGRFALSIMLQRSTNPLAALGVFGGQSLSLGLGAVVDGYDSSEGSYESQLDPEYPFETTGRGAWISSNQDATLAGYDLSPPEGEVGTTVFGDCMPGPSGAVDLGNGAQVTGSTAPRTEIAYLPELEVPELTSLGALLHADTAQPLVLTSDDYRYVTLAVAARAKVVLKGPITVVADILRLEAGSELAFDTTDGPVTVYCPGVCDVRARSVLSNVGGDPKEVALLIGAETVTFNAEGTFYGTLYAPAAPLTLPSSLRLFGSVAAESLALAPGGRVSLDVAMASSETQGVPGLPEFLSWRIVELPDAPIVKLRIDPRNYLDALGVDPVPSPDAHAEEFIRLLYRGIDGLAYAYQGPEADLDWSVVERPIHMRWAEAESLFPPDWEGFDGYGGAQTHHAAGGMQSP